MAPWLAIFALAACAASEWGVAPDAQRGFGTGRKVRDLERLLRSTDEDDQATLAALRALPGEVEVLVASAVEPARLHKYMQILERDDPQTLEQLGLAFRAAQPNIQARLERGSSSAVFSRMLVDLRFRVRAHVAQGLALEVRELSAALGLLGAQVDGSANLTDREVDLVARRADLAASRLRAIKLDLTALRADAAMEQGDIDSAGDRERLRSALSTAAGAERDTALMSVLADLKTREERGVAVLFTELLAPKVETLVRARKQTIERAAAVIANVRTMMPDTPEGRKPPADVRDLSKASRYSTAARAGMEAIALDPLSDALCYLVAVSVDFQWGIRESRQWFDRYLALRGIRANDHRTYKDRQLTPDERRALEALQIPAQPPR